MPNTEIPLCDPYVWEDPRYLFRSSWLDRYLNRRRGVCMSELVNEIIFVYVFSLFAGLAAGVYIGVSSGPVLAGIAATIYLIPTFLKLQDVEGFRAACLSGTGVTLPGGANNDGIPAGAWKKPPVEEGFQAARPATFNDVGVAGNDTHLPLQDDTYECVKNPFHNVLVDQIKYAPTRAAAPDITKRKKELDEFFRVQWYSDPTDVFGKAQSQREFVSAPVTTIPNDQESYQNWLYKIPGKTCKEGGAANCWGGTDGAPMPWLNL
jgi:hypothetical protein